MKECGLGLRELCRAVGMDPSFFSKVLAEKRSPPSEEGVLRLIARELALDAPRLIVAAGRIPREWRRLWSDDALFDSVHGLASGGEPLGRSAAVPADKPGSRRWGRGDAVRAPLKSNELGEELL